MAPGPPAFLHLCAGLEGPQPLDLLAAAYRRCALDLLEKALAVAVFEPVVLATDDPELARAGARLGALVVAVQGGSFAATLLQASAAAGKDRLVYCGRGTGALASAAGLRLLGERAAALEQGVLANNIFSADILALHPAAALQRIALPPRDNGLALALCRQAGLAPHSLEPELPWLFDIDTPTDLAILKLLVPIQRDSPAVSDLLPGPRLAGWLAGQRLELAGLQGVLRAMRDPLSQLLVAGRVGSHAWATLERQAACKSRVYSEERGLGAEGREEAGPARSLLGLLLEDRGPGGLVRALGELAQAALLDSRVLLAHRGQPVSRQDRFWSDLGQAGSIADPWLRELTAAAAGAPIPIVLGGHSLMSGGLLALCEVAWRQRGQDKPAVPPAPPWPLNANAG